MLIKAKVVDIEPNLDNYYTLILENVLLECPMKLCVTFCDWRVGEIIEIELKEPD